MDGIPIWVLFISTFLFIPASFSESEAVRNSLVQFITNLSNGTFSARPSSGWNLTSDPCTAKWAGVECNTQNSQVKKIILDGFNLTGTFDPVSLCSTPALAVLSLNRNLIAGSLPDQISDCRRLTHLYLNENQFSGPVPSTVARLNNLKRFEVSNNAFSGQLPDLARVSGLISFVADGNRFTGGIPSGFDFTNLERFNISNNNLSGPIPDVDDKFGVTSFSGNPNLCGPPLPNLCPEIPPPSPSTPLPPSPSPKRDKNRSRDQILIFSGYILLGLVVVSFIVVKAVRKKNKKNRVKSHGGRGMRESTTRETSAVASTSKLSGSSSSEAKATTVGNSRSEMRSEYSITSADSGAAAASFVLLSSPLVRGLKFNDLLKAPAELLGKGKHGSVYKVVLDNGAAVAVKRTKDWGISSEDFSRRIKKIDKVKHPRVLNPLAFYCSDHEKLLVYEYQPNASLFMLLHGAQNGHVLDWGSRLVIAACVAEALAVLHRELQEDEIAHGNLKSTNILFNKDLEPCISEYGLMVAENPDQEMKSGSQQRQQPDSSFKVDVYWFGMLLLEMLTGKLVQNNGNDLAKWVHSVVREEWTVEVFDRALTSEGASDERMVNLLQVALKCITPDADDRPSMGQIAGLVNAIREEEDRSIVSDG